MKGHFTHAPNMTTGLVFDIQHFSVHDGPGIRTTVFMKGCPLRCEWCCNPESQAIHPELRHSKPRCRGCMSCARACTKGGVLDLDAGPVFDRDVCDVCTGRECVEACPERALSVSGRVMTVQEVVEAVKADEAFYRNSGGGVTLSGGEPLRQHLFVREVLEKLKAADLHTAVETCGLAASETVLSLEPLIDLFLFDLKLADPALHRRFTGQDNTFVLDNLAALSKRAPEKIVLRFPLIPGITDDPANVKRIAGTSSGLGIRRANVVPYHPIGLFKYAELGRRHRVEPRQPVASDLDRVFEIFESAGMYCYLG